MTQARKKTGFLLLAFILISLSMRAPTSGVGPLSRAIGTDLGLDSAILGLLTTIPLMIFAVTAPLAGKVALAIDNRLLILGCLLLNALGMLLRSYGGLVGLMGGTALLGLGIGTLNVLMPAFIRRQFAASVGLMMGVYSASMTAMSALTSGTCQGLAEALGSWRGSLAFPALYCVIAMLAFLPAWSQAETRLGNALVKSRQKLFCRRNLLIALYMGLQSFFFFSILAWLPSIVGWSHPQVKATGMLVLVVQGVSLLPSFIVPVLGQKAKRKGLLTLGVTLFFSIGFWLVLRGGANLGIMVLGAVVLGLAIGSTMSLALTFVATQGVDAADTARISGFCQCIGYSIASFGPTGLGYVFDRLGSWTPVLWIVIGLSLVMALLGYLAGRHCEK